MIVLTLQSYCPKINFYQVQALLEKGLRALLSEAAALPP
jgi:hypothetical protein